MKIGEGELLIIDRNSIFEDGDINGNVLYLSVFIVYALLRREICI